MTIGEHVFSAIMTKGAMKVVTSGDSLLANFTATNWSDGVPITRPPFTVGAKTAATGAVFTQVSEVLVNTNGKKRKQRSTATWTLEIAGDQLTGMVKRTIVGG